MEESKLLLQKLDTLTKFLKANKIITSWTEYDLKTRLNIDATSPEFNKSSGLFAFLYQGLGYIFDDKSKETSDVFFRKSYDIWKTVWFSSKPTDTYSYTKTLFFLTATGIQTKSFAEIRMILKDEKLHKIHSELSIDNWADYLEQSLYIMLLILVRKADGWTDINYIQNIINTIKRKQDELEPTYLEKLENMDNPFPRISWLASLLNIMESLEVYCKFIVSGKPDNVDKIIMRFNADAYQLAVGSHREEDKFIVKLYEKSLLEMVNNSVWTNSYGISEKLDDYIKYLTSTDNESPIFELYPSQQKALQNNLLDSSKTAVVVQMPTSAGKTLLSKFYILQTLNLYQDAKIAYIVPTRALVNQVKNDLRRDFKLLGIKVDVAIPFAEIDPLEEEILLDDFDILVTTPEKLDVLYRNKHKSLANLKLVVVDEAHSLADKSRGSKLELLLALLRRENRNLRILLLSPFLDNAKELASWLGDSRGIDIYVDWKPAQQYTGIYSLNKLGRANYKGVIQYIPSSLNTMYNVPFEVDVNSSTSNIQSKSNLALIVAQLYESLGGVLVLCINRDTAEGVIKKLIESRPILELNQLIEINPLLKLIEEEIGADSLLYEAVQRGCAYHHSSLPIGIREEIENAVVSKQITVIAATTTLAQGMNFPISTVIFQGMSVPEESSYSRQMTDAEFWNISGRAGRALTDKEGHIIAITKSDKEKEQFKKYLSKKNNEVLSSLLETLKGLSEHVDFNLSLLRKSKGLTNLLQYIYHILSIDKNIEIEDIIRGSLVYHQLTEHGNTKTAEKLVSLTREYQNHITSDLKNKKKMEVITGSGLSSLSMNYLLGNYNKELKFAASNLFAEHDETLSKLVKIVGGVPEIDLGIYKKGGNLNPELVAEITKDWVNGKSLREIALKHIQYKETLDEKIQHCGKYIYGTLTNNLSWGIAAFQKTVGMRENNEVEFALEDTLIPSYIYFGVNSKEAAALSMLGVPRFASKVLGKYWSEQNGDLTKEKVVTLKKWLNELTEDEWLAQFDETKKYTAKISYNKWRNEYAE